ncbi:Uncharacterised protein [uncultured Bacteroides sp.]|nr:Uncharacterised protein [uncultured Bacteroides sp.]
MRKSGVEDDSAIFSLCKVNKINVVENGSESEFRVIL